MNVIPASLSLPRLAPLGRARQLFVCQLWLLAFVLLGLLMTLGRAAGDGLGSIPGPPDQTATVGSVVGPLSFQYPYYWEVYALTVSSSNQALVPDANINANPVNYLTDASITIRLAPGQRGRSLITLVLSYQEGAGLPGRTASFDFFVEVPMEVAETGGSANASNLATRGVAFAKDLLPGSAIARLNDGLYGEANSWIGNSASTCAGISFGTRPIPINRIAFGRDNTGTLIDRLPELYNLEYTTVPNPNADTPAAAWQSFGTVFPARLTSPAQRHAFSFTQFMATGVRVSTPADGMAIDELELYNVTTGPMVVAPDDQSLVVRASSAVLPFTTSLEPPALTVTASSSNPSFIPNANITLAGSPGNRTVKVTPAANAAGTAIITLTVNDGTATASDQFTVRTILPQVSAPPDQLLALGASTAALPFTTSIEPNLVVTASSSNPSFIPNANITLGGALANRTVKVTPLANAVGTANITLTVSDGVQTASAQFKVSTIPPSVRAPANQKLTEINTSTAVLPFTTSAEPNHFVTATSSDQAFIPNANLVLGGSLGNRTIQVTPAPDRSGVAVITLTVSDGVQSATSQFTVSSYLNLLKEGGTFRNGNLATAGTAFAKNLLQGYPAHTIPHLNDGIYGNDHSWIPSGPNSFAGVNLGATAVPLNCIAIGTDNTGVSTARALDTYTVQYTTVANPDETTPDASWISVGIIETALFPLPARRHLFSFPQVSATGVRILTTADGPCLDEIELYSLVPAIGAPPDQTIFQTPYFSELSTGPLTYWTSPGSGLSVSASSSNPTLVPYANIVLGGSPGNRTVTVTAAPDQTGTAVITLAVTDGTRSTTDSFTLTFIPSVTYLVGSPAALVSAIQSANGSVRYPVIRLTGNLTLSAALPFLIRSAMVDGAGFLLNGGGFNGFVVGSAGNGSENPDVTFRNLTISGATAWGGSSANVYGESAAANGGMGGGGGAFGGALFVSNGATVRLDGVNLLSNQAIGGTPGQYPTSKPSPYGSDGANGIGTSSNFGAATAGDSGPTDGYYGGLGGVGFGAGGGGAGFFGTQGGSGSYGGGGGGTSGGYDGGTTDLVSLPGFGGGAGVYVYGGGGAGLGGAIFVQSGGTLLVSGALELNGNSVVGGQSYGLAFGSGIFAHGSNAITFSPADPGTLQRITDVIADEFGSGGGGVGAQGLLSVIKTGLGTTFLTGSNTYSGTTFVQAGRLVLTGSKTNTLQNDAVFAPYNTALAGAYIQGAKGTFQARLGSDRLDAGSVTLAGKLDLIVAPGAPVTPVTIINNYGTDPVIGTFAGLPEGARFISNGNVFRISYLGGTGNDVVVTLRPPFDVVEGGTAPLNNLALRGTAFAKDVIPGFPDLHTIAHLNDGIYGNANSWIGNSANSFAGISFGSRAIAINQVAFGRDNTGGQTTRAVSLYTIQYTTVPNPNESTADGSWITIGTIDTATLANPALRHLFNFPTLMATGIRVITAVSGTAIDELEVFNASAGLQVVAPDDQTIAVSTSSAALLFTTSATGLTISATSENPTLIPNEGLVIGGTASRPTVTVTPAARRYGSAVIILTVSDGTQTATDRFLVTVPLLRTPLVGPGFATEADDSTVGNVNLALPSNGGTAFAKDVIQGYADHTIDHLNDGLYGNSYSWVAGTPTSFAGINLGGLKKINRVAFGRDNTLVQANRFDGFYTIQYTTATNPDASTTNWTTLGGVDLGFANYFPSPAIKKRVFSFPPVLATGLRILTEGDPAANTLAIDELEIFNLPGPEITVEQNAGEPLMHILGVVDFGQVTEYAARTIELTLTNPGSAPLLLGTISKGGSNPGDFTLTPSSSTIASGSSAKLRITFAPGATGNRGAQITIASNAIGSKAAFAFNLSGQGIAIPTPPTGVSSGLTLVETGGTFAPDNIAPVAAGGTAFAKDLISGYPQHTIPHLNDGIYGNGNSWLGNSPNSFGGIKLSGMKAIDRIAFGRDNSNPQLQLTRVLGLYAIQYTTAPNPDATTTDWTTLGTVDLANSTVFGTEASGGPAMRHLFSFAPVMATGVRILTVADGVVIDEIEVYEYFTPQEQWRRQFFNTPENIDSAADGADPDGDNENNLFEFATGQNPTARSRSSFQQSRTANALILSYTRSLAALAGGVTFTVETCDDLVAGVWSSAGVSAPVVLSDDGKVQRVQVTVPTSASLPKRFARLIISNN